MTRRSPSRYPCHKSGTPHRVLAYLESFGRGAWKATPAICDDLDITPKVLGDVMRAALRRGLVVKRLDGGVNLWSLKERELVPITPHLKIVLIMVATSGGASSAALASQYGCSHDHMQTLLRRLRERGLICRVGGGSMTRWVPAELSAQMQAALKEKCRLRNNARARDYERRMKAQTESANEAFVNDAPRQTIVPAHLCAPVITSAVPSVFHLAECAA